MKPLLCILVCENFHPEVAACIAAEGWSDVISRAFPGRCGQPPVTWEELKSGIPDECTAVVIFGRACVGSLSQPPPAFPPVQVLTQDQCFHLIASRSLVDEAIADGSYLMSPAWVCRWREHIAELGFTTSSVGEFYREFAKQLVLLDTGVQPGARGCADEFSRATGLPVHRVATGLDHIRLTIGNTVLKWRLAHLEADSQEYERIHHAELADQACALDLLGRLTQLRHETEVIAAIEDMFRMLFAPNLLYFHRVDNHLRDASQPVPLGLQNLQLSLKAPYAWTADGLGFVLLIAHDGQELARILVDRLAFAQYRERYLNLALAMAGVCGLAIESARTRQRLLEAEKMASLGVMVAGIAHEINTPVGVSVLAASSVERATTKLADSFAERSMTQSALQTYLNDAQSQTSLILSNLQRIGRLIDSFRQVAVHGLPQTKASIRLNRSIQDVIASFGPRISGDRIAVHVDCDASLEIDSYPGDWVSIFTNLIANSLQHGFKDAARGRIDIAVNRSESSLFVDYRDDGKGLSIEARERIFDPFFTTDLQNGMGLGMHLVYNLITQRMRGSISCEDPIEKGVYFRIAIPIQTELTRS
jgi:signal transduction histidine kinase